MHFESVPTRQHHAQPRLPGFHHTPDAHPHTHTHIHTCTSVPSYSDGPIAPTNTAHTRQQRNAHDAMNAPWPSTDDDAPTLPPQDPQGRCHLHQPPPPPPLSPLPVALSPLRSPLLTVALPRTSPTARRLLPQGLRRPASPPGLVKRAPLLARLMRARRHTTEAMSACSSATQQRGPPTQLLADRFVAAALARLPRVHEVRLSPRPPHNRALPRAPLAPSPAPSSHGP